LAPIKASRGNIVIEDPPLLTIKRVTRLPADLLKGFAGAQTGHLVDCMEGRGALHHSIKPVDPQRAVFCGPAITAHAYPADNLAVFGALAEAAPGDVIVVANDSWDKTALVGDLVCGMMKNKGVAALVTDGLVRDVAGILPTGLPTFAAGVSPNSPAKAGPGTVGFPVTVGGVLVCSGDIIVGDADGVVVVPRTRAEEVLATLAKVRAAEAAAEAKVKAGATMLDAVAAILSGSRVRRVD